jgi:SAM-dependent methyltransferase
VDRHLYAEIDRIEHDHWWYVGRRAIVFDWVSRAARDRSNRILDIGCGTGYNVAYLQSLGFESVVGLDLAPDALAFARARGLRRLVQGDATRAPFRRQSFDLVLALDLIEHVEDDGQALHGLFDLLRPGGTLLVFTPAYRFLWSRQDEVSHHFRRYTASELQSKIEAAGFTVAKLSYANTLLFPVVWAGRLARKLRPNRRVSENEMHPAWANRWLQAVFAAERPLLRHLNLPFGVSLLCLARKAH